MARLLLLSLLTLVAAFPAAAQTATPANFGPDTFRFNDRYTTPFGPAYADIWVKQANFLACKPPLKQRFTYALCFFSGPAVPTPVPTDGSVSPNPPLPCVLSADGKSADCTCYALSTEQYPPLIPYFIDINAILNLDLNWRTIRECGHDGSLCGPRTPFRGDARWNQAPVCRTANRDRVLPDTPLISVFSPVKNADYATGADPNSTSCGTAKYAGCMTAPCRPTGKLDASGHELV